MNKAELIAAVAENAELTKKDAEKAVKAFIDVVTDELKKGEKVQVSFLFSCRSTAWGELPAGLNLRLPGGS